MYIREYNRYTMIRPKWIYIVLAFFSCILFSCDDEDRPLTAFEFRYNGHWFEQDENTEVYADYFKDELTIRCDFDGIGAFTMYINNPIEGFTYDMVRDSSNNCTSGGYFPPGIIWAGEPVVQCDFVGQVFLHEFDLERQILKGRFHFEGHDDGEFVRVETGAFIIREIEYFDLEGQYLNAFTSPNTFSADEIRGNISTDGSVKEYNAIHYVFDERITITFNNVIKPGIYRMGQEVSPEDPSVDIVYHRSVQNSNVFQMNDGSLFIQSIDSIQGTIEGTFSVFYRDDRNFITQRLQLGEFLFNF